MTYITRMHSLLQSEESRSRTSTSLKRTPSTSSTGTYMSQQLSSSFMIKESNNTRPSRLRALRSFRKYRIRLWTISHLCHNLPRRTTSSCPAAWNKRWRSLTVIPIKTSRRAPRLSNLSCFLHKDLSWKICNRATITSQMRRVQGCSSSMSAGLPSRFTFRIISCRRRSYQKPNPLN